MTKTLEELLSGGSTTEVAVQMAAHTKRSTELFAKPALTAEELTEATRLDSEYEQLQTKHIELKAVDDMKSRNKQRNAYLNDPLRPQFSTGEPEVKTGLDFGGKVEFPFASGLKNFKGQEGAKSAFRFGMFVKAIHEVRQPGVGSSAQEWCKANGIEIKIQQEATPQDGGVLVPVEFERTLIDLREMYGSFRANAKTEPMAGEQKTIPRRTGGLTAYFVGEGAQGTNSTKSWDLVTLNTKKIMVLVPYSTEIAEDAVISMADDLAGEIAYAFALKEDNCGFLGDGTSTYGGITGVIPKMLNLSGTIANIAGIRVQATISTGTFASAILGDFQAVIGKLPKYADSANAKWYMHKTFFHSVPATLMVAAGGNAVSDLQGGARKQMFLGYPVEFAQVLPSVWVANQIFAVFGDLRMAASFGDRRATTLFTDPYSLSDYDQIRIRGTERFDINIHDVGNASATATLRVPGPVTAFASAAS